MEQRWKTRAATWAALLSGIITAPGAAEAQTTAAAPAAPAAAPSAEIVVTAMKREQNIVDVPVAVSAYDGDQIAEAQVQNLADLQQIAPSLTVNSSNGSSTSSFILRGFGTSGTDVGLEQSVGVFIDGVYRGRPGAALVDLTDIERIEVLRGPQGALFGRNTSAGVISIVTRAPDFAPSFNGDATFGSDNLRIVRARVSGPVIDDVLAVSLSGGINQRDGFVDDVDRGVQLDTVDRWNVRGQALWAISPDIDLRVIVDRTDESGICCSAPPQFYGPTAAAIAGVGGRVFPGAPGVAASIPGPTQFTGVRVDPFARRVALNVSPDNSFTDGGVSTQLDWDFGGFTLTAQAAYRGFTNDQIFDADFTSAELFTNGVNRDIAEYSGELRLTSNGDEKLDWLFGASYFDQSIKSSILTTLGVDARPYFNSLLLAQSAGALSFSPTIVGALGLLSGGAVTNANLFAAGTFQEGLFRQDGQSWSVFGHADLELTDWLTIGGDLRYLEDEKSADFSHRTNDAFSQVVLGAPLPAGAVSALRTLQTFETFNPYTTARKDDAVVGSLTATLALSEDSNLYARYARGFKGGGINLNFDAGGQIPGFPGLDNTSGQGVNPQQALFAPESVDAYEVGVKGSLFQGKIAGSMAVFLQTLDDYQVNSFDGAIGAFTLRNAAELESRGVELEYQFRPIEILTITGAAIYLDSQYKSFPNGPQIASPTPAPTVQDLSGQPPIFAPEWTLSGGVSLTQPIGGALAVILSANYRYRSEYFTGLDNDPETLQDANTVVDASATLAVAGGRFAVQFWGKNVTDETVRNIVFDTPFQNGSYNAFLEPPRTYGVTVRIKY